MTDINEMTADARPKLSDTLTAVRDTAQQIRKYTKQDVAELLANLREVNTEILKIAKDFATVSSEVKEVVLLHRDDIDEMVESTTSIMPQGLETQLSGDELRDLLAYLQSLK